MDEHAKWHTCKQRSQIIASPPPPPPTPMHLREIDRQSRTGLIFRVANSVTAQTRRPLPLFPFLPLPPLPLFLPLPFP